MTNSPGEPPGRRYSPTQAAELTGWDVQTIRRLLREQKISGEREGSRWYLTPAGLDELRRR
ncbi:helix-turn-helix domain-containing protein [Kribbella sp. NPDC050820]|uniref:helix-turn-helix domain-containing protein n=1 Tax=Kribbella sp. NPDC050820 TaxID=3155408 RepID=UPI0033CD00DF